MNRKLKKCSGCGKDSYLWKSNPPLCKACAMRSKARNDDSDKKVSVPHKKKKVSKKIAPVSEKQKERLSEYRKVRDEYLRDNPKCEICGKTPVELPGSGMLRDRDKNCRQNRSHCILM